MPKIVIKKGDAVIKKLSVPEDILAFTVGCEQGNDIIINDESISFFHLQFEKQNDEYFVRDLQSQWGTFINGRRITGRTRIHHNDEVGIGNHMMIFIDTNANSTPASAVMAENYELKQSVSNRNIEDKMAGVPSLMHLNSWLNDEQNSFERKGDFLIDSSENGSSRPSSLFDNDAPDQPINLLEDNAEKKSHDEYNSQDMDLGTENSPRNQHTGTTNVDFYNTASKAETGNNAQTSSFYLLGIYGYYLGRKFRIKQPETRIGRDRKLNDIVIKKNSTGKLDQSVSRRHATLNFKNGNCYISDKRSKSRTWINQRKLDRNDEAEIKPGDEIEIISDKKNHIFRMVEEGDWDYSFPQKAGAWYIRHRMNIFNACSAIIILAAGFFFVKSFITRHYIASRPSPLTITETMWGSSDIDSKFNGIDESKFSIYPAIADLNGDDFVDLIYVNNRGFLNCINGKTKEPLWTNNEFQAILDFPITIEDLYNKGTQDVIVVSKDFRLRAIDGNWGIEIWKSPILAGPLTGPPVIADFNGDGLKDLAVASTENAVYIGYSSLRNFRWVPLRLETEIRSIASAGDLDKNGIPNILVGNETGKVIIIDGINQNILKRVNVNEEFNKASGQFNQINQIRFPVALGDLDGDSAQDLVVSTVQGNLITLNGRTLERLWYDLQNPASNEEVTTTHSVVLGDLDGDDLLDIVSQTAEGKLRAIRGIGQGKDRKMVLWEYPPHAAENFIGYPVLADFNKNGTMDVVAANKNGAIYIFEGSTGNIIVNHNSGSTQLRSQPVIGDLDNDNHLDILALKSNGRFYKLSTNSLTLGSAVVWGQTYGNSRHTNTSAYKERDIKIYYTYMGSSLFVILILVGLQIFVRQSRSKLSFY